jgi:hypothetical protein
MPALRALARQTNIPRMRRDALVCADLASSRHDCANYPKSGAMASKKVYKLLKPKRLGIMEFISRDLIRNTGMA